VADVQVAPPPPVDEYISDSTVGSDNEVPATSRQTLGKILASQVVTQIVEAKKRR
jgi:hypothetical protein